MLRLHFITLVACAFTVCGADRDPKWARKLDRAGLPNLHCVTDNIYRCAQPTADGMRAAEKLGIPADQHETYARTVVEADFEKPGDGDVIEKVRSDLAAKGIVLTEPQLRTELDRHAVEAKRQLMEK